MKRKVAFILILVVVSSSGGYLWAWHHVRNAVSDALATLEFIDFGFEEVLEFNSFTTIMQNITIQNPTNLQMTISIDLDMLVGDNYITNLTAEDITIQSGETTLISFRIKIDELFLKAFLKGELTGHVKLSGTVTVKSMVSIFPIKLKMKLKI